MLARINIAGVVRFLCGSAGFNDFGIRYGDIAKGKNNFFPTVGGVKLHNLSLYHGPISHHFVADRSAEGKTRCKFLGFS